MLYVEMRITSKLMILHIDYMLLNNNLTFICASKAIDSGNVFKANLIFKNYSKIVS